LWRNRRAPWLLMIALILLAVVALWVFLDYQRTVAALAVQTEYNVTRLTASRIREELADFPNALATFARTSESISNDPDQQAQALQRTPLIREGLFDGGLVLLDNFGSVTAAEPPRLDIMRQDWSDRPYFRELLNVSATSAVFSNAVNEGSGGSQVIVVSVPVIDGEERFVGALVGMLRLSRSTISPYYATLVKMRVSPDGTAYLVDRSGRILFDSASQRNGEQYTNHALPGSGESDASEAVRTRDATGRELLVSHAPIPGTPWTLVIEKDWENLIAPTKSQANLLLVLLGLAAILPLVSLTLLVRQHNNRLAWEYPIQRESDLAHQIDRALLPGHPPILPGWEIAVHCEPGLVAGRVFYDAILGIDGCLTLIVGEMSTRTEEGGDSVTAVLSMVGARTLLRGAARSLLPPAEALEDTNRSLFPDMAPGDFVACLYCRLDPARGAVQIGNAGQVRPLQVTAAGAIDIVGGQDPPLALHLECPYSEFSCTLAPGDFLLFYSSGVVDARNANGEPFGFARLERALTTPMKEGAQRIQAVTDAIREFAGVAWAGDRDAILIVVERMQSGAVAAEMQES
jgi:serine phosphatase RsbU (regulator of sigma subunit)